MSDESKQDGEGPVKPQVIDLEAEDVTVEPEAKSEPAPPPPRKSSGGMLKYVAAALVIGLVAGGWLYRDLLAGYLPGNAMTILGERVGTLEASTKTINEQLAAVSQQTQQATSSLTALEDGVKSAQAAASDAGARAATAEQRLADLDSTIAALRSDLDTLRQTVTTAGANTSGGAPSIDQAALAAIGQRLDALEKDVASLKSTGTSGGQDTAALTQALSDLKAKVAAGVSYRDEYDRIFRMVPAAAGLDVLGAHADQGLPTPIGLAAELRAGIPTLPSPAPENSSASDGYIDAVLGWFSGLVTIRDIGEADWPALAEKSAAFADANDLPQAIAVIDEAEGEKPSLIAQWRDRSASRLKLEAALIETETAVLRQIAVLGDRQ